MAQHVWLRLCCILITLLSASVASAASTDRTVLYALTSTGELLSINTSNGAATLIKQIPYPFAGSEKYQNLVVYKGTFLTQVTIGPVAFGLAANDHVRLPNHGLTGILLDFTESSSSGRPRYWTQTVVGSPVKYYLAEFDPLVGSLTAVSGYDLTLATSFPPNWSCPDTGGQWGSGLYGTSKGYFFHFCGHDETVTYALVRAELQNTTWVKTLDSLITGPVGTDAVVADPNNDGVLYTAGGTEVVKVVISGSTMTSTEFTPNSGLTGSIKGLAFGPPTADVLSPKNVSDLNPFDSSSHPWTPMQMLFTH